MKEIKFIKVNKIKYSLECRHCLKLGWEERMILSCKHAYHPDCLPDVEPPEDSGCVAASSEPVPGPSHENLPVHDRNIEHQSKNEVMCPACKSRKLLRCVLEFNVIQRKPGKMLVSIIADYHFVLPHGMFWSTIVQKRWVYYKVQLRNGKKRRASEILNIKSVYLRSPDTE